MTVLVVIEAVVLALLAVLVAGLLRSHAEILRALHDLGVGHDPDAPAVSTGPPPPTARSGRASPAADVAGVTPAGEAVAIGVVGAAQPTLLAFLSSGCITCRTFWEAFAQPRLEVPGAARLVVVTMGPEAESESALAKLVPPGVPVVMSSDAWDAYGVPGSPYFVYVDGASGTVVGEGTASDWARVTDLVVQAADDGALAAADAGQRSRARRAERRRLAGRAREARADEALMAAGILPGDPRLYPATGEPPGAPE